MYKPNIEDGYWLSELDPYMLLATLRKDSIVHDFWKEPRWKESYIRFMAYWRACCEMH